MPWCTLQKVGLDGFCRRLSVAYLYAWWNTEREMSRGFALASLWNKENDCEGEILGRHEKNCSVSYRFIVSVFHLMVLCNSEILTRGKDTDEGKMHRRKKTGMKIENKKQFIVQLAFLTIIIPCLDTNIRQKSWKWLEVLQLALN